MDKPNMTISAYWTYVKWKNGGVLRALGSLYTEPVMADRRMWRVIADSCSGKCGGRRGRSGGRSIAAERGILGFWRDDGDGGGGL
ncbi:hypothetical protein MSAS_12590 [Mycobacterium saskatchewanense]|nr:hypothetical protein MSAS_12590 [Mycobacterium saskatchewanense]